MTKTRKPGPWHEIKREIGRDAKTDEAIYEVREQRFLPGGYTETRNTAKRFERKQ